MADRALELRTILDSAERAASARDFASAEYYLRRAADIQEAQLGALHPDLANTLNNLGIMYERVGKPADAEASYRRAYAIAAASLPDDDPLVLTSGQNLKDFCVSQGKPFDVPAPASSIPSADAGAPATSLRSRRMAMGVVIGSGMLLAILIALAGSWSGVSRSPAPAAPAPPQQIEPPPREEPPPPEVDAAPQAPAVADTATPRPVARATVSVVEARLCRPLSLPGWRCTPATNPAQPGAYSFYTRVKSERNTTVQHRWYLNGRLLRAVDLRIAANPGAGYRTYTRNTISTERRGDWRIELRDAQGTLLHEERVVVP